MQTVRFQWCWQGASDIAQQLGIVLDPCEITGDSVVALQKAAGVSKLRGHGRTGAQIGVMLLGAPTSLLE